MNKYSDRKIIDSWKKNVQPWVVAVRTDEIESGLLVTNKAIIDAVLSQSLTLLGEVTKRVLSHKA